MWCLTCNALSDAPLCSGCRKKLASLSYAQLYEHRCPTCGTPVLDTAYGCDFCQDALLSYGVYDGILEQLITSYKHAGNVQAAWQLATLFEPLVRKFGSPILIPIPSSISGKRNLGFDHMALVTAILCRRLHLSSVRLLAQQRHDLYTLLTRKQRQQGGGTAPTTFSFSMTSSLRVIPVGGHANSYRQQETFLSEYAYWLEHECKSQGTLHEHLYSNDMTLMAAQAAITLLFSI